MSYRQHVVDPVLIYKDAVEEIQTFNDTDFVVIQRLDKSFVLDLGFLNDIIQWNVQKYAIFLENIQRNISCEYDFRIGVKEPCTWVYKKGYFFYTVWDCGEWFSSYKIPMNADLLTKLQKIGTQIVENIDAEG